MPLYQDMKRAAITQARERCQREQTAMTVYYGTDIRNGKPEELWYVRDSNAAPPNGGRKVYQCTFTNGEIVDVFREARA